MENKNHNKNCKRMVSKNATHSHTILSVAKMNWNTNKPNPFELDTDDINTYKNIIKNEICNGKCCK